MDGGSGRRRLLAGGILAALALAVGGLIAVIADDGSSSKSNLRAELAAKFKSEGDLSQSDAECLADYYIDDLGADAFKDIDLDDPSSEPPSELQDEFIATGLKAGQKCNIDGFTADSTTTTTTIGTTDSSTGGGDGTYGSDPELDALYDACAAGDFQACDDLYDRSELGSEYEGFADSCGNRNEPQGYCVDLYSNGGTDTTQTSADFEQILGDTYARMFPGLTSDKAQCLAHTLATAIEDGSLSESQALSDFLSYISDCDISLSDLNPSGG
jgi:hypothetical protein